MSKSLYGVNTRHSGYIDTSKTLRGAKIYATRNGYDSVCRRNVNHYYVHEIARKIDGKWVDVIYTRGLEI